ncbi:MAG: hypothetical protein ACK47B_28560 [Armatimonadota bacterium]
MAGTEHRTRGLSALRWGLLAVGLLLLAYAAYLFQSPQAVMLVPELRPLSVPLALDPGATTTADFTAEYETTYELAVEYARGSPFEGNPFDDEGIRNSVQLDWSVESGGERVGEPDSSRFWGETIGFTLGRFEAAPGQKLTVRAITRRARPELQPFEPRLSIFIAAEEQKDLYWRLGRPGRTVRTNAFLLAVVGIASTLTAVRLILGARRRSSVPAR